METPDQEKRYSAALHEAAHGVLFVGLGGEPPTLTLRRKGDEWEGACFVGPDDALTLRTAVVACGGLLAASRLRPVPPPDGVESDMGKVWDAAAVLNIAHHPEMAGDLKDCIGEVTVAAALAGRLVEALWEHIEGLALYLMEHDDAEVGDLVDVAVIRHRTGFVKEGMDPD